MVGAKPEIQGIVGAVELQWVILATVFADHVSRGTFPIMNLKEVIVAIGAALQMKEGKGNAQNLKRGTQNSKDLCQTATFEIYSHPLMFTMPMSLDIKPTQKHCTSTQHFVS